MRRRDVEFFLSWDYFFRISISSLFLYLIYIFFLKDYFITFLNQIENNLFISYKPANGSYVININIDTLKIMIPMSALIIFHKYIYGLYPIAEFIAQFIVILIFMPLLYLIKFDRVFGITFEECKKNLESFKKILKKDEIVKSIELKQKFLLLTFYLLLILFFNTPILMEKLAYFLGLIFNSAFILNRNMELNLIESKYE